MAASKVEWRDKFKGTSWTVEGVGVYNHLGFWQNSDEHRDHWRSVIGDGEDVDTIFFPACTPREQAQDLHLRRVRNELSRVLIEVDTFLIPKL